MAPLIRNNSTRIIALQWDGPGIPQRNVDSPSEGHLCIDPDGNLRVTVSGGVVVASEVTVNNGIGNPVPVAQNEATTVPTQVTKTVASTGTPEAIAADGTLFKTAFIIANKAARTPNTGTIWLGPTSTNGEQPIELAPGDTWRIDAPAGQKYDLNDWYLDVEIDADGVVVVYS